ncbi:MAG: hypothetical protein FJ271_06065 [Planctomycetes bacterium]|nr:hypothetical protein [Planctomycetota bacterium]
MSSHKRRRLWVDPAFQFRLLVRMAGYIVLYTFMVVHVEYLFVAMASVAVAGPAQHLGELYLDFLGQKRPMLITGLLFTPIILYDLLKFSHRIAGPLFRCRQIMLEMVRGNVVPEFKPRKRDFMRELFQAFNYLIREWNARVEKSGHPEGTHDNAGDGSTAIQDGGELKHRPNPNST